MVYRLTLLLVLSCSLAFGEQKPVCGTVVAVVISKSEIYVHCPSSKEDKATLQSADLQLWEAEDGWDKDPRKRAVQQPIDVAYDSPRTWRVILKDPAHAAQIQSSKQYAIILGISGFKDAIKVISTKPEAVLTRSEEEAQPPATAFDITSAVDLKCSSEHASAVKAAQSAKPVDSQGAPKPTNYAADVAVPGCRSPEDTSPDREPNTHGMAVATLTRGGIWKTGEDLSVDGLKNVLDADTVAKGKLKLADPPKGKDDAKLYLGFTDVAATNAFPTLALQAKAAPPWISFKNILVQPQLNMDIARNVPKPPDTIQFGGMLNRTITAGSSSRALRVQRFGLGDSTETNREGTLWNNVGVFEWQPYFKKFWESREQRTRELANDKRVPRAEAALVDFGYGMEMTYGVESGKSIAQSDVTNKAKTETLQIPEYAIVRGVPKLHGFLEYKNLTLDATGTLRWLGTVEYSGEVLPSGQVHLRRIRGFRPYQEFTASYALDPSKHLNLAITYKNGSQPPGFSLTNQVSSGLVFKY